MAAALSVAGSLVGTRHSGKQPGGCDMGVAGLPTAILCRCTLLRPFRFLKANPLQRPPSWSTVSLPALGGTVVDIQ